MISPVRRALLAASLAWLFVPFAGAQSYQDLLKPNPNDWLHYNGTYDSQRHSLLKQINTGNEIGRAHV